MLNENIWKNRIIEKKNKITFVASGLRNLLKHTAACESFKTSKCFFKINYEINLSKNSKNFLEKVFWTKLEVILSIQRFKELPPERKYFEPIRRKSSPKIQKPF